MHNETHVLVDEAGIPVLRGTYEEMIEQEAACHSLGIEGCAVEPIQTWNWSMVNWGD